MGSKIAQPFDTFTDIDGDPLEDGSIYIGQSGLNPEVSPISVFFDSALSVPAAQPIRTAGGYASQSGSPARLYVAESSFSITVRNKNGTLVHSSLANSAVESGFVPFVSVADLRANALKTQTQAATAGYTTAGDGGAALYYLDAADTTSADDGFLIIVATDGGRWKLNRSDEINVRWAGATGDGVTDDYAAVQAVVDYLNGRGGGFAYLPAGTYAVKTSVFLKDRVSLRGDGSRVSTILWGDAGVSNFVNGVVYAIKDTGGSPDLVFSSGIECLSIVAGGVADVSLAIRGQQENCVFADLVLSQYLVAGLDILTAAFPIHGVTFRDLHIIPTNTASGAYGIRGDNVSKCLFENITTDIENTYSYARGVSLTNAILNFFDCIHTEDCQYGVRIDSGSNNVFGSLEALNNVGNGVAHFYTVAGVKYTIRGIRTYAGFTDHIQDGANTIPSGAGTDSIMVERGASFFRRVNDTEDFTGTSNAFRRGVQSYAGTSGVGQTELRVNDNIAISSTRYAEIDVGAAAGFAGKIRINSTGSQRYSTEAHFSGFVDGAGTVSGALVSTQVGTTPFTTIGTPVALAVPASGKFRIPLTNTSGTFSQVIEVFVEITRNGGQAVSIAVAS